MELTPEQREQIYQEEIQKRLGKTVNKPNDCGTACGCVSASVFVFFIAVYLVGSPSPPPNPSISSSPTYQEPPKKTDEEVIQDLENALEEVDKKDKAKIGVLKGWKWEAGEHLDYIRGSVKNASNRTVRYWKVTAQFLDKKGNIIDTNYTNSAETLLPSASKRFEIMFEAVPQAKHTRCFVEEVVFDD